MGIIISILSYVTKIFTNLTTVQSSVNTVSSNVTDIKNNTFTVSRYANSGAITLAAYEQWLYQDSAAEPFMFGGGIIDLSNLQAGDKVTVKLWACLYSGDSYRIIGQVNLSGPLTLNSKLEFGSMYNRYGVKVGIMQTAGSYRSVQHEWFLAKQLA
jgi:hypothetical protein